MAFSYAEPPADAAAKEKPAWTLVWSDEFDGDLSKWVVNDGAVDVNRELQA